MRAVAWPMAWLLAAAAVGPACFEAAGVSDFRVSESAAMSSGAGAAGGGGGDGGMGGSELSDPRVPAACDGLCDYLMGVGCSETHEACLARCASHYDLAPWCVEDMLSWVACQAAAPLDGFTCDETSGAAITGGGICGREILALQTCFLEAPDGLPFFLLERCLEICPIYQDLSCAQFSPCEEECQARLFDDRPCRGAFGALIYCWSGKGLACQGGAENLPVAADGSCSLAESIYYGCSAMP
jgi:hypothetical protein